MAKSRSQEAASAAKGLELTRYMAPAEAFRVLTYDCTDQLLANGKLVQDSAEAEPLHKMRVAIRKILSLFFCFKAVLPDKEAAAMRRRLKGIFKTLGVVRSLDVLLNMLQGADATPALQDEVAAIARERQAARRKALRMLRSQRFQNDIDRLLAFVDASDLIAEQTRIDAFVAHVLDNQWRGFRKSGALLALNMDERHQVRLRVKKLRYTCEFFGDLVCSKGARRRLQRFRKWLDKLQATLGDLNDRAAAEVHVSPALWREVQARQTRSDKKLLAIADTAQKKLKAQKRFW